MRWFEKPEVLSYIVECYAGVETIGRRRVRQFVWEDADRNVVIGNPRAFVDHLSDKFELDLSTTSWSGLHEALRAMGEVAKAYSPRARERGGKFRNQELEVRVLKRGGSRGEKA